MAKTTHDTKRAVIAAVERLGHASPKQIAEILGGDFLTEAGQVYLRQLLNRMVRKGHLLNPSYGVYTLSNNAHIRGLDNFDARVRAIARFLRKVGGSATTGAIHDAVGDPRTHRVWQRRFTADCLRTSPLFENYGYGLWRLVPTTQAL